MRVGRNVMLWRQLVACVLGVWIAVPVLAAPSKELDEAVRAYNGGNYQQSQEWLLKVDRDALSDEQKQHRDQLMEAVRTAINQSSKAKQDLADGDKAFAAGDLDAAETYYAAVQANDYASQAQKDQVRKGLAQVAEKRTLQKKVASGSAAPAASQPAESSAMSQARLERNQALAAERVRAGDAAIQAGQFDLAEREFQQALQRVPAHPEALNGLELVRRHREAEGLTDLLDESVKRRRSRWIRTETLYRENERAIRAFIDDHQYDQARQKLEVTSRLLTAARQDAEPPDRYGFLMRQVEALGRFIDARQKSYEQEQSAEQRRIVRQQEQERREAIRREKDERVAQLMEQVMQFQKERRYDEAGDVLREILAIDPDCKNAEFLLRMIQDTGLLHKEKETRNAFLDRMQESFLAAEQARNPETTGADDNFVAYPDEDEWRLIANRDPFGAALSGESDEDREARERLESNIPSIDFSEATGLEEVIEFLRTEGKVDIETNWNALEMLGIDRMFDTGGIRLQNKRLETILDILVEKVGGLDAEVGYDVVDGVVRISTKEDLERRTLTRVYDVRDLLIKIRSFSADEDSGMGGMGNMMGGGGGVMGGGGSMMGGGGGGSYGGGGGGGYGGGGGGGSSGEDDDESEEDREELVDELEELIKNQVEPGTWTPDGELGSMDIWNDRMIVTHTPRAHRQLVDLLTQLRESKDIQIMVEARFVTLRSNFLEEIGVDLDVVLNNGNAGLDQALIGGEPAVDPTTGATLLMPRRFNQLGFTPGVASAGIPMAQSTLDQAYNNVALVPPGSPSNYWSRHTTPIPVQNNSVNLAAARGTGVPGSLADTVASAGPAFSLFGSFLDNIQVDFLLRATQMDSRGSSVDAPRLTCYNGREGFVEVNTLISYVATPGFVPSGGSGVGGQAAQGVLPSIGMLPRGRLFSVLPTVSGDRKYVTMQLKPQVTDVSLKQIPVQQGTLAAYFQTPEMQMTQIKTTVSVPDGGTLLLGGLRLSAEEEVEAGVPVVSKIPVLKRAFTNRSRTKDEFVLLVLVKPTVIIPEEQEAKAFDDLLTSDQIGR